MTIAFAVWCPWYGFRDESQGITKVEYGLVFLGSSISLVTRVILLACGQDPFDWDSYCYMASTGVLLVLSVKVICHWRRAVYGESKLAAAMGVKPVEARTHFAGPQVSNTPAIEMGPTSRPLAIKDDGGAVPLAIKDDRGSIPLTIKCDVENNQGQTHDTSHQAGVSSTSGTVNAGNCKCVGHLLMSFLLPALMILFSAAGDAQTITLKDLNFQRADVAVGTALGLVCSCALAVAGGWLMKIYLWDTHLLAYVCLVYMAQLWMGVKQLVIHTVMRDIPELRK